VAYLTALEKIVAKDFRDPSHDHSFFFSQMKGKGRWLHRDVSFADLNETMLEYLGEEPSKKRMRKGEIEYFY